MEQVPSPLTDSIFCLNYVALSAEHEGIGRLAALGGHAEMSHDSDEWELVSSEVDEEL